MKIAVNITPLRVIFHTRTLQKPAMKMINASSCEYMVRVIRLRIVR